jgi:SAM-dependent methyltransferase
VEVKEMENIYTSGQYFDINQTWHAEDSPWKAEQISRILQKNRIQPESIAEIGCGAGLILNELSKKPHLQGVHLSGYDISPQAIELTKRIESERIKFFCEDLLSDANTEHYDILLIIDVFEHIINYMGFVEQCRGKAQYKIFHIPLDIHVSSVLRNTFIGVRYTLGHLHYFTADSAIATLKDIDYEILDCIYTNSAFGLFRQHPSIKKAIANLPRWLFSKFSIPFTARVFGGYSLLVLAK